MVDVADGRVVRAQRGERASYRPIASPLAAGSDPSVIARALLSRCAPPVAPVLYVADLDAIQGGAPQLQALAALSRAWPGLTLWIDAGFAHAQAAHDLRREPALHGAAWRAVYGSESIADAAALEEIAADAQAILSLDCRQARPLDAAGCWRQPQHWPPTVVVMTLDRVGADAGPDLATFARLRAMAPGRCWIGAGGVRHAGDLADAAAAGAAGWLVASALHDGRLGAPAG